MAKGKCIKLDSGKGVLFSYQHFFNSYVLLNLESIRTHQLRYVYIASDNVRVEVIIQDQHKL